MKTVRERPPLVEDQATDQIAEGVKKAIDRLVFKIRVKLFLGIGLVLAGYTVLLLFTDWKIALGLFLVTWGIEKGEKGKKMWRNLKQETDKVKEKFYVE